MKSTIQHGLFVLAFTIMGFVGGICFQESRITKLSQEFEGKAIKAIYETSLLDHINTAGIHAILLSKTNEVGCLPPEVSKGLESLLVKSLDFIEMYKEKYGLLDLPIESKDRLSIALDYEPIYLPDSEAK